MYACISSLAELYCKEEPAETTGTPWRQRTLPLPLSNYLSLISTRQAGRKQDLRSQDASSKCLRNVLLLWGGDARVISLCCLEWHSSEHRNNQGSSRGPGQPQLGAPWAVTQSKISGSTNIAKGSLSFHNNFMVKEKEWWGEFKHTIIILEEKSFRVFKKHSNSINERTP